MAIAMRLAKNKDGPVEQHSLSIKRTKRSLTTKNENQKKGKNGNGKTLLQR